MRIKNLKGHRMKLLVPLLIFMVILSLSFYAATLKSMESDKQENGSTVFYLNDLRHTEYKEADVIVTNLESRDTEVFPQAYDIEGNLLGLSNAVILVEAEKGKIIDVKSLPVGTETLRLESETKISGSVVFKAEDTTPPYIVPGLKNKNRILDFPRLLSGDTLHKVIAVLNPNHTPTRIHIIGINENGETIADGFFDTLSSMENRKIHLKDIFEKEILNTIATVRVESEKDILGVQRVDYPGKVPICLPAIASVYKDWSLTVRENSEDDNSWASIGIYNPGDITSPVSVEAFDHAKNSLGSIEQVELASHSIHFIKTQNINGKIPPNAVSIGISSNVPINVFKIIGDLSGPFMKASLSEISADDKTGKESISLKTSGENTGDTPSEISGTTDSIATASSADYDTAWSFGNPLASMPEKSQKFGVWNSGFKGYHLGEDYTTSSEKAVKAIANGKVRFVQTVSKYGYVVIVEHTLPDGAMVCSVYGHMRKKNIINNGTKITKGQQLGYLSSNSKENGGYNFTHLHIGIRSGKYSTAQDSDKKWRYRGYGPKKIKDSWYSPSIFISRRSNGLRLSNLKISPSTPKPKQQFSVSAKITNNYYYGGNFKFRLRVKNSKGQYVYTGSSNQQWLNPNGYFTLTLLTSLNSSGSYNAVIEFLAPGTGQWWELSKKTFKIVGDGGQKRLESLYISGYSSIFENTYADYTARANFSDGSTQSVTHSTSWSENSSYASFDSYQKNRLHAKTVSSNKTVRITAQYTYKGVTKVAYQNVTIKNQSPSKNLTSVSISGPASINENSYAYYYATAHFSDGSTLSVTNSASWSENSSYAYFDSSPQNRLRTRTVSSNQTVKITAAYSYNGVSSSGYKYVTINNGTPTYSINTTATTNGGGTWGSILTLSASLSGTNLTLTVRKKDGSTWTSSGKAYFKVGSYQSNGSNRYTVYMYPGYTYATYQHDLSKYSGGYPKQFYVRFESNVGGYAWVGPITVTEK